jgi:hypothetical protein
MTFMRPSYQPLPISDLNRQYTLERYAEGSTKQYICKLFDPRLTTTARTCSWLETSNQCPMFTDSPRDQSVPVLFLPGSSGNKAQVRSIASEAYRTAERRFPNTSHSTFTVYTVGTNEELSAMDARLINSQAQFVSRCLQYLHTVHPVPVAIVVGHSMGVSRIPVGSAIQTVHERRAAAPLQQLQGRAGSFMMLSVRWCRRISCKSCCSAAQCSTEFAASNCLVTKDAAPHNDTALCSTPQ